LAGKGFKEVYNMAGGIKAYQGHKAVGPQELNLDLITGDESPAQMIAIAFQMEENLGQFYRSAAGQTTDDELIGLLNRLAGIEEKHKASLLALHTSLSPDQPAPADITSQLPAGLLEGGFNGQTLIDENQSFLESAYGVLDLAMMLETQAMDLYMRFADKSVQSQTGEVLFKIASEEKAHLQALGELYDEKIQPGDS